MSKLRAVKFFWIFYVILSLIAISSSPALAGQAILSWDPNAEVDLAGYKVYYGTVSGNYTTAVDVGQTSTPSAPSYTVANLTDGITYYFAVTAYEKSRNESGYSNEVFKMITDTTPPIISGITASNITSTSAIITWSTNEAATSQVEYGTTTTYGSFSALNPTLVTSHSRTLSSLLPFTTYHFRVLSRDAAGNLAVSGDNTFTTSSAPDTTPPGDVQDFTAFAGDQQIILSWTNPPDSDFVGVRIVYRTDRFPNDINDGILLGDFTGQPNAKVSTLHSGLQNGVTYYYIASSYDGKENFQSTARASATPSQATSNNIEPPGSSSGGGCGMILPKDGTPPGPGQVGDMMAILMIILLTLVRKSLQAYKLASSHAQR